MDLNLDDSDDETKSRRRAPSRVHRHAPKSSKSKPEPAPSNPEEPPKPESLERVPPESVQANASISNIKKEGEPVIVTPQTENAAVNMEIDAEKAVAEAESERDEPMDEDSKEEEEEEDMIVREIDVYFTPSIDPNTQLYVLQYPLRPCWRPYELEERCDEVRVKPTSAEVEVDLAMDLQSNCDTDFANRLKMTKQTLSSSWKPPRATGYAVGVLMGNELHLNPIHAVVQLRPSLEHLNSGGSKRKKNVTGDVEVSIKLEDTNEEKSAGPSKKQNKQMESTEQKTDDEESWVALKYHGQRTDFSARYLQRMVAKENSPIHFTMNPDDYINSLCPGACNNDNKPKGSSRRLLLSMPLEERIKTLLSEEPLFHRFSSLKYFAPDDSDNDVLGVLQQHALLIQGLWTPKRPASLTEEGGVTVNPLIRDYILLQFSQKLEFNLDNSDIPTKRREEAKAFLKTVAVERPSLKDWKFKEHKDESFIKSLSKYPDIVEKQKDIWKNIEENVGKRFGNAKTEPSMKNVITKPGIASKPGINSDKGTRQSGGVRIGRKMSDETREALPKALKKVFQTYKVCSLQLICQGLREFAVSQATLPKADSRMYVAAAHGIDASQQEFEDIISQVATKIRDLYVLKSSPEHPEYDQLRKVVITLLNTNEKLKKTEVFSAAKIELKRDITNNEYIKVMNDLCESKGSAWVLKSGDGSSK